jgi:catechol 2,3-dioxygenase-like lactoylglutathione lyase family enzyme
MERDAIEPHIWANDLDASRRFYEDVLAFEVVQRFPDDAPTWFQLRRGTSFVMLTCLPDKDPEHARCQAAGALVVEPLWDPWWGGRELTVEDPDGNWWTLCQRG